MGSSDAPAPPNPQKVAAAQTGANIGTAIANQQGSMVNQVTPYGTLNYNQTGSYSYHDPSNPFSKPIDIPTYTATMSYTPEGQAIVDQDMSTRLNLATLGADQSGRLNNLLAEPLQLGNEAVEARIMDLLSNRMDDYWGDQRASTDSILANKGIKVGSTAYDKAMDQLGRDRNDSYTQAMLTARGQALQEMMTERTQPINEILALMGGGQVQQPNFVNTPGFSSPTTDVAGIMNNHYQQQLAQHANSGFDVGGLFGLAGSLGSAAIGAFT